MSVSRCRGMKLAGGRRKRRGYGGSNWKRRRDLGFRDSGRRRRIEKTRLEQTERGQRTDAIRSSEQVLQQVAAGITVGETIERGRMTRAEAEILEQKKVDQAVADRQERKQTQTVTNQQSSTSVRIRSTSRHEEKLSELPRLDYADAEKRKREQVEQTVRDNAEKTQQISSSTSQEVQVVFDQPRVNPKPSQDDDVSPTSVSNTAEETARLLKAQADLQAAIAEAKKKAEKEAEEKKKAVKTRRRRDRSTDEYKEKEQQRRRTRSQQREAERAEARKAEVEYVRQKLGLDAAVETKTNIITFSDKEMIDRFGTWENWKGHVPRLIETPPTPAPGMQRGEVRVYCEGTDYCGDAVKSTKEKELRINTTSTQENDIPQAPGTPTIVIDGPEMTFDTPTPEPEIMVAEPPDDIVDAVPEFDMSDDYKPFELPAIIPFTGVPYAPVPTHTNDISPVVRYDVPVVAQPSFTVPPPPQILPNSNEDRQVPIYTQSKDTVQAQQSSASEQVVLDRIAFEQQQQIKYGPELPPNYSWEEAISHSRQSETGSSSSYYSGQISSGLEQQQITYGPELPPGFSFQSTTGANSSYYSGEVKQQVAYGPELPPNYSWEEAKSRSSSSYYSGESNQQQIGYGPELPPNFSWEEAKSHSLQSTTGASSSYYSGQISSELKQQAEKKVADANISQYHREVGETTRVLQAQVPGQVIATKEIFYGPELPANYSWEEAKSRASSSYYGEISSESKQQQQIYGPELPPNYSWEEAKSRSFHSATGASSSYYGEISSESKQQEQIYGPELPPNYSWEEAKSRSFHSATGTSYSSEISRREDKKASDANVSQYREEMKETARDQRAQAVTVPVTAPTKEIFYGPELPSDFSWEKARAYRTTTGASESYYALSEEVDQQLQHVEEQQKMEKEKKAFTAPFVPSISTKPVAAITPSVDYQPAVAVSYVFNGPDLPTQFQSAIAETPVYYGPDLPTGYSFENFQHAREEEKEKAFTAPPMPSFSAKPVAITPSVDYQPAAAETHVYASTGTDLATGYNFDGVHHVTEKEKEKKAFAAPFMPPVSAKAAAAITPSVDYHPAIPETHVYNAPDLPTQFQSAVAEQVHYGPDLPTGFSFEKVHYTREEEKEREFTAPPMPSISAKPAAVITPSVDYHSAIAETHVHSAATGYDYEKVQHAKEEGEEAVFSAPFISSISTKPVAATSETQVYYGPDLPTGYDFEKVQHAKEENVFSAPFIPSISSKPAAAITPSIDYQSAIAEAPVHSGSAGYDLEKVQHASEEERFTAAPFVPSISTKSAAAITPSVDYQPAIAETHVYYGPDLPTGSDFENIQEERQREERVTAPAPFMPSISTKPATVITPSVDYQPAIAETHVYYGPELPTGYDFDSIQHAREEEERQRAFTAEQERLQYSTTIADDKSYDSSAESKSIAEKADERQKAVVAEQERRQYTEEKKAEESKERQQISETNVQEQVQVAEQRTEVPPEKATGSRWKLLRGASSIFGLKKKAAAEARAAAAKAEEAKAEEAKAEEARAAEAKAAEAKARETVVTVNETPEPRPFLSHQSSSTTTTVYATPDEGEVTPTPTPAPREVITSAPRVFPADIEYNNFATSKPLAEYDVFDHMDERFRTPSPRIVASAAQQKEEDDAAFRAITTAAAEASGFGEETLRQVINASTTQRGPSTEKSGFAFVESLEEEVQGNRRKTIPVVGSVLSGGDISVAPVQQHYEQVAVPTSSYESRVSMEGQESRNQYEIQTQEHQHGAENEYVSFTSNHAALDSTTPSNQFVTSATLEGQNTRYEHHNEDRIEYDRPIYAPERQQPQETMPDQFSTYEHGRYEERKEDRVEYAPPPATFTSEAQTKETSNQYAAVGLRDGEVGRYEYQEGARIEYAPERQVEETTYAAVERRDDRGSLYEHRNEDRIEHASPAIFTSQSQVEETTSDQFSTPATVDHRDSQDGRYEHYEESRVEYAAPTVFTQETQIEETTIAPVEQSEHHEGVRIEYASPERQAEQTTSSVAVDVQDDRNEYHKENCIEYSSPAVFAPESQVEETVSSQITTSAAVKEDSRYDQHHEARTRQTEETTSDRFSTPAAVERQDGHYEHSEGAKIEYVTPAVFTQESQVEETTTAPVERYEHHEGVRIGYASPAAPEKQVKETTSAAVERRNEYDETSSPKMQQTEETVSDKFSTPEPNFTQAEETISDQFSTSPAVERRDGQDGRYERIEYPIPSTFAPEMQAEETSSNQFSTSAGVQLQSEYSAEYSSPPTTSSTQYSISTPAQEIDQRTPAGIQLHEDYDIQYGSHSQPLEQEVASPTEERESHQLSGVKLPYDEYMHQEQEVSSSDWNAATIPLPFSQPASETSSVASRRKSIVSESSTAYTESTYNPSVVSRFTQGAPSTAPTATSVLDHIEESELAARRRRQQRRNEREIETQSSSEVTSEDEEETRRYRHGGSKIESQLSDDDSEDISEDDSPTLGLRGGEGAREERRLLREERKDEERRKRRAARKEEKKRLKRESELAKAVVDALPAKSTPTPPPVKEEKSGLWGRFFGKRAVSNPKPTVNPVVVPAGPSLQARKAALKALEEKNGHRRTNSDLDQKSLKKSTSDMGLGDKGKVKHSKLKRESTTSSWEEVVKEEKVKVEKRERRKSFNAADSPGTHTPGTFPEEDSLGSASSKTPDSARSIVSPLPADLDARIAKLRSERVERGEELETEEKRRRRVRRKRERRGKIGKRKRTGRRRRKRRRGKVLSPVKG
ncbi:hypothetical protein K440DRAFT_296371 [Wilcoxina mikolae CBS 423.85]|nr:hypothetical protein K440DRAFT_296371 [Wilcoxina mikolae CBS 423.85]